MRDKNAARVVIGAVLVLCVLLSGTVVLSAAKGFEHFSENKQSTPVFKDVRSSDWFSTYVTAVAEKGLMVGTKANTFAPKENVTLAQTITIAARLHAIYHTGAENFEQGKVWYQVYLDYAKMNGIACPDVKNYDRAATRAQFAQIIASAFPAEALREINDLSDTALPDVTMQMECGNAVYALYRAGILTGNDAKGTFAPNSKINRSEVAAIVVRMVDPGARVKLDLPKTQDAGQHDSSAAGQPQPAPAPSAPTISGPTFHLETVQAQAGQGLVPVTVSVKNNPGIAALALNVSYDSALVLKNIVYNEKLIGETMMPQKMQNPFRLLWLSPFADVKEDFVLATLYFDVLQTAAEGPHTISVTYDPNDVFDMSETNVHFEVVQGTISVKK